MIRSMLVSAPLSNVYRAYDYAKLGAPLGSRHRESYAIFIFVVLSEFSVCNRGHDHFHA